MQIVSKTPMSQFRSTSKGQYHSKIKSPFRITRNVDNQRFNIEIKKISLNENTNRIPPVSGIRISNHLNMLPYITSRGFNSKVLSPVKVNNDSIKDYSAQITSAMSQEISGSVSPNTKKKLYLMNKKNLFNYQGIVPNPNKLFYSSLYFPRNGNNNIGSTMNKFYSPQRDMITPRTHSSNCAIKKSYENAKISPKRRSNTTTDLGNIKSFYAVSTAGYNRGVTKTNQDNYITLDDIPYPLKVFGVFDGHGEFGHLVSGFLRTFFNDLFLNSRTAKQFETNFTSEGLYQHFTLRQNEFLSTLFSACETKLSHLSYINANYSGSTCILVFIIDDYLICANVGDSRAILLTNDNKIIQLSRDHKPNLKDEYERIISSNGKVERMPSNATYGPFRVWKKNENCPGLAMSRSIGDFVAETVGVICEPEVTVYKLSETKAKSIIIASDGVWEFTSNEKVKSIVWDYYNKGSPQGAATAIREYASKMWSVNGDMEDDITVIVLFF